MRQPHVLPAETPFPRRLAAWIKAAELTHEQVAEMIGASRKSIGRWTALPPSPGPLAAAGYTRKPAPSSNVVCTLPEQKFRKPLGDLLFDRGVLRDREEFDEYLGRGLLAQAVEREAEIAIAFANEVKRQVEAKADDSFTDDDRRLIRACHYYDELRRSPEGLPGLESTVAASLVKLLTTQIPTYQIALPHTVDLDLPEDPAAAAQALRAYWKQPENARKGSGLTLLPGHDPDAPTGGELFADAVRVAATLHGHSRVQFGRCLRELAVAMHAVKAERFLQGTS